VFVTFLLTNLLSWDTFLHTGNTATDRDNAILLHTEGDGKELPSLFVVENAEEIVKQREAEKEKGTTTIGTGTTPPPPPPGPVPPPPGPVPPVEPQVQMMLYIGGQQYGPYDYKTLKQFVPTGQLTKETLVWQQGMAAWTPAGQVPELQGLFAPAAPTPPAPPVPPVPGGVPPVPPTL
jgi:hypothetical protein